MKHLWRLWKNSFENLVGVGLLLIGIHGFFYPKQVIQPVIEQMGWRAPATTIGIAVVLLVSIFLIWGGLDIVIKNTSHSSYIKKSIG